MRAPVVDCTQALVEVCTLAPAAASMPDREGDFTQVQVVESILGRPLLMATKALGDPV
jgi:hypothetical protein